jgi:hypothetical protein
MTVHVQVVMDQSTRAGTPAICKATSNSRLRRCVRGTCVAALVSLCTGIYGRQGLSPINVAPFEQQKEALQSFLETNGTVFDGRVCASE